MNDLERWMRHALALADRGRGFVEPNPMVGAVVLDSAGTTGRRRLAPEVRRAARRGVRAAKRPANAPAAGRSSSRSNRAATTGRPRPAPTRFCRPASRGSSRRWPTRSRRSPAAGSTMLRDAGVEVHVGLCEAEAQRLNAPYLKLLRTGRPWVHAKWAMTLDGKIATAHRRFEVDQRRGVAPARSRTARPHGRDRRRARNRDRRRPAADGPPAGAASAGARGGAASGDLPERCQLRATARDVPVIVYTARERGETRAGSRATAGGPARRVTPGCHSTRCSPTRPAAVHERAGRRRGGPARLVPRRERGGRVSRLRRAEGRRWPDAPSPVAGSGIERMADALRLVEFTASDRARTCTCTASERSL